jgi:Outer membrane protein beta-barrel domain
LFEVEFSLFLLLITYLKIMKMKKLTTLVLAIFLFAGVMNAQIRFGIKGGATSSSISTETRFVDQMKSASSYQGGVLLQLKLGGFAIQPEILYSVKGSDFRNVTSSKLADLTGGFGKLNYETQNIDIPINLQLGWDLGPARVYAQAGPYFSFLLSGALNGSTKVYDTVDKELEFNKYDVGLGIGAGAELFGFQLALKFDYGMKDVAKKKILTATNVNVNPFYEAKNRTVNVSLGYLF